MDEKSLEDWSPVITKPGLVVPETDATPTTSEAMALEYLDAIIKPLTFYSFPETREEQEGGVVVEKVVQTVFQIIHKHSGRKRIKAIPTIQSLADKSVTAKLAFFMQPLSVWSSDDGHMHVLADSDPYWVVPDDIAPFGTLQGKLLEWPVVQPSATVGCQVLSDSIRSLPTMPLTDSDCPTVMVLRALKQQGWKQNPGGKVVHNSENVGSMICDARGGVKQKRYLQCLLDLPSRLALTSCIPSYASQRFFMCLLLGKKAEPFQKVGVYDNVLLDGSCDPEVLALEDEVMALNDDAGGNEDEIMVAGTVAHIKAKPKPKSKPANVHHDFLPLADVSDPARSLPPAGPGPPAEPSAKVSVSGASSSGIVQPVQVPVSDTLEQDDDQIVVAGAVARVTQGPRRLRNYIAAVGEIGSITRDVYAPINGPGYTNWIMRFEYRGKTWEKKRLVTDASTRRLGPLEPIAFVHAWRDMVVESEGAVGARQSPSAAAVETLFNLHRGEFEQIFNQF